MSTSTLRARPVWKSTRPEHAKENDSSPDKFRGDSGRGHTTFNVTTANGVVEIHALVLRLLDINDEDALEEKLRSFSQLSTNGNSFKGVVLILQNKAAELSSLLAAMSQVQMLLLQYQHLAAIPADSLESVQDALQKHLVSLQTSEPSMPPDDLMASATAAMPGKRLATDEVNALKSVFPAIVDLEAATRTEEGRVLIRDFLPSPTARDVIDFWEDEWLAVV